MDRAPAALIRTSRSRSFDHGNDDYWGDLPWWTVDQNRFLCPDATCNGVQWSGLQVKKAEKSRKSQRSRRAALRR
ncbi:MAG: hypothetical protein H0V29_00280 [Thermoleophilaceae bacterium]|nr:hypothetical protein [Thermoleophilaceae bacterium]